MTYINRKRSEKKSTGLAKKKDWENTEERVRIQLGFRFDKHCRALGIDGARVEKIWFLEDQKISSEKAIKLMESINRLREVRDKEVDMVWEFSEQLFLDILKGYLGRELTEEEVHSSQFEEMDIRVNWIYDFFPEDEYIELERLTPPIEKEIVTFLEVKDWKMGHKVNVDEIDKFVGKMIRGDATHGVFVARSFSRSVQQVVRDHNVILTNLEKSIVVKRLKAMEQD